MITYSIKPPEAEGQEEKVVKVGHPYEFTATQVRDNMLNLNKTIKELAAKAEYEKAVLLNIEHHHPAVLNLPPETVAACKLYLESKLMLEKVQAALTATEETVAKHMAEIAEIAKQTGKVIDLVDPVVEPKSEAPEASV